MDISGTSTTILDERAPAQLIPVEISRRYSYATVLVGRGVSSPGPTSHTFGCPDTRLPFFFFSLQSIAANTPSPTTPATTTIMAARVKSWCSQSRTITNRQRSHSRQESIRSNVKIRHKLPQAHRRSILVFRYIEE